MALVYSFTDRRLTLNDNAIRLAPKCAHLLTLLLSNPGTALNKDDLLQTIWGADSDISEGSLTQHVFLLRRLLGQLYSPYCIETLIGIGYRFNGSVRQQGGSFIIDVDEKV